MFNDAETIPVPVFISFADADRDAADDLMKHLATMTRAKRVAPWHRGLVAEGDVEERVARAIKEADLILLLVSSSLLNDRYAEIETAIAQRGRGARVIPVLVRDAYLEDAAFRPLKMVPDGKPIYQRPHNAQDAAWVEVVKAIRTVVEQIPKKVRDDGPRPPGPGSKEPFPAVAKILFMSANPVPPKSALDPGKKTVRTEFEQEFRDIEERLRSGEYRDKFVLETAWAVTRQSLIETLLRFHPTIVHIAGIFHRETSELLLEDGQGKAVAVDRAALVDLFRLFAREGVRCVVLSAGNSEPQARAISEVIEYVVGMAGEIPPASSRAFAEGFYIGLVAGRPPVDAVEFGRLQMRLTSAAGAEAVKLFERASSR